MYYTKNELKIIYNNQKHILNKPIRKMIKSSNSFDIPNPKLYLEAFNAYINMIGKTPIYLNNLIEITFTYKNDKRLLQALNVILNYDNRFKLDSKEALYKAYEFFNHIIKERKYHKNDNYTDIELINYLINSVDNNINNINLKSFILAIIYNNLEYFEINNCVEIDEDTCNKFNYIFVCIMLNNYETYLKNEIDLYEFDDLYNHYDEIKEFIKVRISNKKIR